VNPEGLPPSTLYKFRSIKDGVRLLVSGKIAFATRDTFNDPFDLSPIGLPVRHPIKARREARKLSNLNMSDPNQKRAWKKAVKAHERSYSHARKTMADYLGTYGICCMTSSCTDLLQWAHYADRHRGIAVGINSYFLLEGKEPGSLEFGWGMPHIVNYSDVRPKVHLDLTSDTNGFQSFFCTKSMEWAYEKEFRFLKQLPKIPDSDPNKLSEKIYLQTIAPKDVLEVIIGARANVDEVEKVTSILKTKYPATRILKARLHQTKFCLELVEHKL
jgi:Protein of unknown function (DUF2971)